MYCLIITQYLIQSYKETYPDSKNHGANMGPTWVLLAPGGPHVGPMNLAIRVNKILHPSNNTNNALAGLLWILSQIAKAFRATSIRHGFDMKMLDHYNDVIMSTMVSQVTSLTIVYSTVYSCTDERKHQSSTSLAFVWGIQRGPVNSPHKGPVTQKMFPFDDVIMLMSNRCRSKGVCYLGWGKPEGTTA